MRAKRKILTAVIFLIGCFITFTGYSQTILQEEPSMEVRELADERTDMLTKELSLTAKQQNLVENKIIEYTIKRIQLQESKMQEEEKIKRLLQLESLEQQDMRDILTKPQYEKYLFLEEQKRKN